MPSYVRPGEFNQLLPEVYGDPSQGVGSPIGVPKTHTAGPVGGNVNPYPGMPAPGGLPGGGAHIQTGDPMRGSLAGLAHGMTGGAAGQPPTGGGTPAPQPGGDAGGAIGLENLGGLIERLLGNPSAFGSPQIQEIRSALAGERERERQQRAAALNADAARRGVFHSTIPAFGLSELEGELASREALADAQLTAQAAQFHQTGQQQAIDNAFRFLGMGQQGAAGLANLGGLAGQIGFAGAPTVGGILNSFMQMPGAQAGGVDPGIAALIGQLLQGGGGGAQQQAGGGGFDITQILQQLPAILGQGA